MSGNNNGFFGTIQHSVNSFFYSLTTNDRYASYDSPYRNPTSNRGSSSAAVLTSSNNNSTVSLVDNTGSNRSSISNNRPFLYRPGLRSQLTNNASGDLQLQDYINGQPPLPPLESIWERLESFLDREYPELYDNLGEPATVADLNELESDLEVTLPSDVRESFQIHDGQERASSGLIFGLTLLELEYVSEEANIWKKVCKKLEKQQLLQQKKEYENFQGSPSSSSSNKVSELPKNRRPVDFIAKQKSVPEGAIQAVYAHPLWIPLAKDYAGNNIAVDLAPGPNGRWGQVILFGRDFDTKYVVANSWTEFLLNLVEDYEDGKYIVDPVNETIAFFENNRAVDYLRVLVYRAWAPLRKANADKDQELVANTTALRSSRNNSRVELPKETLITPLASTTDLLKATTPLEEHEIKLDEEEEEEEELTEVNETLTEPKIEKETSPEEKEEPEQQKESNEVELKEESTDESPKEEEKPVEDNKAAEDEELEESTVDIQKEVEDVKEKLEDVAL